MAHDLKGQTEPVLTLTPMRQLSEAKCPEDDWTGLGDRAERRKRQNRLNVRAHRRRKAANQRIPDITGANSPLHPADKPNQGAGPRPNSPSVTPSTPRTTSSIFPAHVTATNPYSLFPLTRDHLIPLVKFNVYRASITNVYILGLYSLLCDVGIPNPPLFPWSGSRHQASESIPESLRPTPLQQSTPHEAWIDILPSPRMRDNAIAAVAEGRLRGEELCSDILEGFCGEGEARSRQATAARSSSVAVDNVDDYGSCDYGIEARMIVWNDPWDLSGWEVTEGFLGKWGFLFRGGEEDMLRSTNRWRALRGEDPIVWEID